MLIQEEPEDVSIPRYKKCHVSVGWGGSLEGGHIHQADDREILGLSAGLL